MAEEVKIVLRQESQGSAFKDAEQEIQRLQATAARYEQGGHFDLAKSARLEAAQLQRKTISQAKADAGSLRAGGNEDGAVALEREAALMQRAASIQRGANVERAEAVKMAAAQIAGEESAAAAKQAKSEAARTEGAAADAAELAAAQKLAAEKLAQAEAGRAEKAVAASQKAEAAERLLEERAITREKLKQAAEAKLAAAAQQRAFGQLASGVGSAAGLGGLGGIGTGVAGGLVAIIAATVGKTIADEIAFSDTKSREQGERTSTGNQIRQIRAKSGVEAEQEAAALRLQNKSQLEEALANRGKFRDQGIGDRIKGGLNGLLGTSFETSGERAARENEEKIARLQSEKPAVERLAGQKFSGGTGGDEMKAREAEAAGDMRAAWGLRKRIEWEQEYQKLRQAGAAEWQAQEGAGLKLFDEEKKKRIEIASGLVSARSGSRDVSRAAQFAGGANDISGNIAGAIAGLHDTVKSNHSEALDRPMNRRFRR